VCNVLLPDWQAQPQPQPQQQQQQQQQRRQFAGVVNSGSGAAGIAAALLQGLAAVRTSAVGLSVYGVLLVMKGSSTNSSSSSSSSSSSDESAGGLQLLVGCYGKQ
jgi:hypothetical protein